jgi:hypothetical protein
MLRWNPRFWFSRSATVMLAEHYNFTPGQKSYVDSSWYIILQWPLQPQSYLPHLMVWGVFLFQWGRDASTHPSRWYGQRGGILLIRDFATALHIRGSRVFSLDASLLSHVTQISPLQSAMDQSALLGSVLRQPAYQCTSHCYNPVLAVDVLLGPYWLTI